MTGVVVALLALAGGAARADDPPVARLTYAAVDGARCPSQEALQNSVASRLGYEPFRPDAALALDARIARDGGGLRAELRVRRAGRRGASRVMRTSTTDCAELAGALTLAISLVIDPLSVTRAAPPPVVVAPPPPPPPPLPPPPAPPPSPSPPLVVVPPPPAPPPARRVTFDVSLGVAASVGVVPRVGVGPVARFTAHLGALSLGLEARGEWSLGGLAVAPAGGASVQLWRGGAFACARAGAFSLCGVVSGGAFAAQGEGLAVSRSGVAPWAAVGARAGADVALTRRLFFRAALDVEAPLVRPSLTLDGSAQWDASAVAASLGASLGAAIP